MNNNDLHIYSACFKLDAYFQKFTRLRKMNVYKSITLNDHNMWNEVYLANINKRYIK